MHEVFAKVTMPTNLFSYLNVYLSEKTSSDTNERNRLPHRLIGRPFDSQDHFSVNALLKEVVHSSLQCSMRAHSFHREVRLFFILPRGTLMFFSCFVQLSLKDVLNFVDANHQCINKVFSEMVCIPW